MAFRKLLIYAVVLSRLSIDDVRSFAQAPGPFMSAAPAVTESIVASPWVLANSAAVAVPVANPNVNPNVYRNASPDVMSLPTFDTQFMTTPNFSGILSVPATPAGSLPVFAGPLGVTLNSDGPPGSQSYNQDPVLAQLFGNMRVTLGFEYLRPFYPDRSTKLVIPANAAVGFPVRGALGNVTQDFAFIPRFGLEYSFPDTSGFGLAASGKLFTLQGNLRRTFTGQGTTGTLNAENSLSIGSANVLEGVYQFDLKNWACCRGNAFENTTLLGSFGGRYAYVRQDLSVSVTSGDNLASLTSTQDFTGFGVTTSMGALHAVNKKVGLYGLARGSVLAGRNNRSSTFSTVAPSLITASLAGQSTEQRSQLIPVGEFEAGLTWGVPLRRRANAANANLPPIMWFRGGGVCQIWGGLGLPDAPQNAPIQGPSFRANPLILAGFTVQLGLSF